MVGRTKRLVLGAAAAGAEMTNFQTRITMTMMAMMRTGEKFMSVSAKGLAGVKI